MAGNPFDYLNSINFQKNDLIRSSDTPDQAEKDYPAFMVNRGLSYYIDTIMYANDTNQWAHIEPILQYEYLFNSVPKKKRFSKWAKPDKDADTALVVKYFGYSKRRAEEALKLLTEKDLDSIRDTLEPGGR